MPATTVAEGDAMTAPAKKRFLSDDPNPARGATYFAETFPKIPALAVDYKRCNKPGCRCARGELHGPYLYLRWREGRVQRRRYVRRADVAAVRAVIESRRRHEREARRAVDETHAELRRLRAWLKDLEAGRWP
jgi:hypothetical protein